MSILRRDPLEELSHWEPFRGIESLQHEMNRLFDRFLPSGGGEIRSLTFVPLAEMEETDTVIRVKLEVPGMEATDLNVEVSEESVSITGERRSESQLEEKGRVRSEFHYGRFERRIPLPAHIQTDKVQAECKNGMLTLTLPKLESDQQKAVKVNIG